MFKAGRNRVQSQSRRANWASSRHLVEPLENRTLLSAAYALSGTNLLSFDTTTPTTGTVTAITGITSGETLVGIDFRPQNGFLYGLGVDAGNDTATLYAISIRTGVAGVVGPTGTPGQIAFTTNGVLPVDLIDPAAVGYAFDFNPAADRIRVVAGSLNFRVNPNTGLGIDGNFGGADGSVTGTNPDGVTNGGTPNVDAAAYTNNQPNNGGVTTLYTLDSVNNSLFIQAPPNAGVQTLVAPIMLGGSPLDFTAINGFDIPAGVNAPSSDNAVTTGSGFAVFNVGGMTGLYSINLVTGAATSVGNVGTGLIPIQGFTIRNDLGGLPAIALQPTPLALVRFNTATPGTTTTQPINSANVIAGETLVGIDYRPQTGQLYGLGINGTNNTGTLYLIDPQNGTMSLAAAGTGGAITFAGEDFPDPATSGWGFDFNPTVDRIRVTTSSGLNFRTNPNTGLPAVATTDGDINGNGSTGVSAAAYTNSFGQPLTGGVTTLYTLDAASNTLFIQNPPNNGVQDTPKPVTLNGSPLDFTNANGFDIPAAVAVATSNNVANGRGIALLTVGGVTGLYAINLTTGAATDLGGSVAFNGVGLALGDSPIPPGPIATVNDVHLAEGNGGGTTAFTFTVTLSEASSEEIRITYITSTNSGTANFEDYVDNDGVLTFAPGETSKPVTVLINADSTFESAETFNVVLIGPAAGSGAVTLGDAVGQGLIENDDAAPTVSIADASAEEGAPIQFTVMLSAPSGQTTTVELATSDGTAVGLGSNADYTPISGPLTVIFLPGATTANVNVNTTEDAGTEPNETFNLNIQSTTNTSAPDPVAVGTILNDDLPITLVVTNTLDSGPGSLRAAINASNGLVDGPDTTITFNIPGPGPHVIQPTSPLPAITDKVTIDGKSEPDFAAAGKPVVILDGSQAGPNADGLLVSGDPADGSLIRGLQIISFSASGIRVNDADDVRIAWNYLGTDGVSDLGNGLAGVTITDGADGAIIGGAGASSRNVISGNQAYGIIVSGSVGNRSNDNVIQGNYIGLNAAGTAAIGNGQSGVFLEGADDTKIGGDLPGEGNVISGNGDGGIEDIVGQRIVIQGNFIGTNAAGLAPNASFGNRLDGISMIDSTGGQIGGTTPAARNVITNNGSAGINVGAQNVIIEGNYIGPDVTGTAGPGNVEAGIVLRGNDNTIGGTVPGAGNVIAFSRTREGVRVFSDNSNAIRNTIRLNSIFSNALLGIDIGSVGVETNDVMDPDITDNNGQNFPVIASAVASGSNVTIQGTLNSVPSLTYVIDFYANDVLDGGNIGEGKTYVGSVGVVTDASGNASYSASFPFTTAAGKFITGTATRTDTAPFGDTSEFGQGVQVLGSVTPPNPDPNPPGGGGNGFVISDVLLPEGNSGTKPFVFTVTRPANNSKATVQYKTQNQTAGEGDYTAKSGTLTFAAGETSKTITINVKGDTKIEGEESFRVELFNATGGVPIIARYALGKIGNDDGVVNPPQPPQPPSALPKLSIGDGELLEGNSGTKFLNVTVTLSAPSSNPVTVKFNTKNGTAGEGDYTAKSGTITFAAGETSKIIQIIVKGDTKKESSETFKVELSNAVNATILDASGTVTIKNDD